MSTHARMHTDIERKGDIQREKYNEKEREAFI